MTESEIPGGAPDLAAAAEAFKEFCVTVAALRDPASGCPWDLEQDHRTLRRYMIEEAYEAAEAMGGEAAAEVRDELGDVLLQVVLNAQVALDGRRFSITDVIRSINDKMRRRHPHVFGSGADKPEVSTSGQVRSNWEVIKAAEKQAAAAGVAPEAGYFEAVRGQHPASAQAVRIGKLAAKIRFDWDGPAQVLGQVSSELAEVSAEIGRSPADPVRVAEEIGDLYFSLAQLCRHVGVDPEVTAMDANRKFLARFARLERLAAAKGLDVRSAARDDLEALWVAAKAEEKREQAGG